MTFFLLTKKKSVVICECSEVDSFYEQGFKNIREADSLRVLEIAKEDILKGFHKKKRRKQLYLVSFLALGYCAYDFFNGDSRASDVFGGNSEAKMIDLCAVRTELGFFARKGFDSRVSGDLAIECAKLNPLLGN
ncbi:hypothetical protein AB4182_08790 [Vibrio splendidus]